MEKVTTLDQVHDLDHSNVMLASEVQFVSAAVVLEQSKYCDHSLIPSPSSHFSNSLLVQVCAPTLYAHLLSISSVRTCSFERLECVCLIG